MWNAFSLVMYWKTLAAMTEKKKLKVEILLVVLLIFGGIKLHLRYAVS